MDELGNDANEVQVSPEDAPGTAVVPVDHAPKPFHQQTPRAIREAVKGELAARSLTGWESEFCRWAALQEKKVPEKDQLAVASALKGGRVMRKELQRLKARGPYQRLFDKERFSQVDRELEKAKARAAKIMGPAMELAGQMVDVTDEALRSARDEDGNLKAPQALEAIRAGSPLVTNLLDRVWPKKHDGTAVAPNITITLSTHQAARIDAAALPSEAIDVPYEVVSEEISGSAA